MKIFITGGTGFLGLSLKEHFNQHEITDYIRGSDITASLESAKPDLIIHCAGEIYKPELMMDTNVVMTHAILEWVRNNPTTRMIEIGSSSEYGPVGHPTSEQDKINPQNIYEATKGAATLLCQGYARHYGLQIAVARIYSGYGAHERPHRLFPTLYRAFFENQSMKLYAGVHDFIYIDDFVRGIELMVNKIWPPGEIVNFGSGRQTTNLEVLRAWEKVTGHTAPVEYFNHKYRPHDTDFWCCDTTYAQENYSFKTEYSLEDGIEAMIRKMK
jgi:dTDP-glucose 4,6-dehydratase